MQKLQKIHANLGVLLKPPNHRPTYHLPTDQPTGCHYIRLNRRPDFKHVLHSITLRDFYNHSFPLIAE